MDPSGYWRGTVKSSSVDSFLSSAAQVAPLASQILVAGSLILILPVTDGSTVMRHRVLFGESRRCAFRTSPPVMVSLVPQGDVAEVSRAAAKRTTGLSTFRGNVRLSVQQKCHLSIQGSYQMVGLPELPSTAASADFRHRCIALRCLCGDPTLWPSGEWTCPRAWPSAPRPSGPVAETSASSVQWSPSWRPRLHRR